MNKTSR